MPRHDQSGVSNYSGCRAFCRLHPLIHFLAVYGDILRRIHANPYLMALDIQNGHGNFVPNHQGLANSPRQYQHELLLDLR